MIQIRDDRDGDARPHELLCIEKRLQISPDQIQVLNVFEQPLDKTVIHGFDAIFVGGSGNCSVTYDYPFYPPLIELMTYACERKQPFFGLCWGFQFMAKVWGGTVEKQIENKEVGTFMLHRTLESDRDPVFSKLHPSFWGHLGHTDFITAIGPELVNLAYTEKCQFQALRHRDAPIYGTQFHPELDKTDLVYRIDLFRGDYVNSNGSVENEIEKLKDSLKDTPESCSILHHFITECVIPYHIMSLS